MKPTTIKYRSKGVTVGPKTKNVALSPFLVPVKNTSTSPIKTAQIAGMKRKLFPDTKPTDDLSITSQSSSISKGYGGRASDIIIVENLECLPPNTAVMAGRGFKDLSHLIENKKCTLIRPPSVFKSTTRTKT
ncbi:uncharacterized protein [Leptinotarsa decemlineata]|uniref:uncharacterized protein n=1 Tax=Leptinotarsa decemlineata TaxID=7539 RepID=UPI003D308730